MRLYSYYRSSAAYRVRIALAIKGLAFETIPVNLAQGEQRDGIYLSRNPQGLVPALELGDGTLLSQSTAILEWIEETFPAPALYAADPVERATQRALCQHVACDIHPLNNLRVLHYLRDELQQGEAAVSDWYAHWVRRGFAALEAIATSWKEDFSLGDRPGMFEVFLVPQLYNARRFRVPVEDYPTLAAIDARCARLPSFAAAHPSEQPDAPGNQSGAEGSR
jgi:maleylacetoacetate isomerase